MSQVFFVAFRPVVQLQPSCTIDFSFTKKTKKQNKNAAPENFTYGSTTNLFSLVFILFNLSRGLF